MGGEWYFCGKTSKCTQSGSSSHSEKPLDVKEYQELLLQLKREYEGQFNDKHVQWCDVNALPPADNVFVRFEFMCENPSNSKEPFLHWFSLYWNPVPQDVEAYGNLHARCSGLGEFNDQELYEIQSKIVEKFPNHFVLSRKFDDLYHSKLAGDKYHNYKKYVCYYDSDSDDDCYDYYSSYGQNSPSD